MQIREFGYYTIQQYEGKLYARTQAEEGQIGTKGVAVWFIMDEHGFRGLDDQDEADRLEDIFQKMVQGLRELKNKRTQYEHTCIDIG